MLLEHHPLEWQELLAGLQWRDGAAHWRAEKEKSQPLSTYLSDMAMINRHVRSAPLCSLPSHSTAVWEHTNHVLQPACSGTEGKHNPLVTAIAKGLGKHNFLVHASLIQTALQWLLAHSALISQALNGLDTLLGHLTTHQKMDCDHSITFAFYYTTGIWFKLETDLGDYLAPSFSVTVV